VCRFPHTECVRSLLKALQELQRLTERGLAVLLLHHPPKGEPRLGQAARGSGVLPAFADILLEMRVPQGDPATRRRRLHGFSRYPDTPQHLLIELTPAGNGYTVLAATADDDALAPAFDTLRVLLLQSETPLTRDELRQAWPPHQPPPTRTTLWRWLTRACGLGILHRTGAGSKCDPFRYGLANAGGAEDASGEIGT